MKDINEKQIEKMTSEVKAFKDRTRFLFGWDGRSKDEIFATLLLEAGYRKESETVREILDILGRGFDERTGQDFKYLEWYKCFAREMNLKFNMKLKEEEK